MCELLKAFLERQDWRDCHALNRLLSRVGKERKPQSNSIDVIAKWVTISNDFVIGFSEPAEVENQGQDTNPSISKSLYQDNPIEL